MKLEEKNIFSYSNYIEAIKHLITQNKDEIKGIQTKLAKHINVTQAYLSRVLSGLADLNQEQIFSTGVFFNLDSSEKEFLITLLNLNRAGTSELRAFYQAKINLVLSKRHNMNNRIEKIEPISEHAKSIYYSDWIYTAIHTLTAIPKYQTPNAISEILNISADRILDALNFLLNQGLIKRNNNKYQHNFVNLHLNSESPYIKNHHTNWRLRAIDDISKNQNQQMHYTSVVSCSESDFKEIQEIMVTTIKKIRETVKSSKDEEVYCYSMDAFRITNPT